MAVHVDPELVVPPQDPRRAADIHGGVEQHLSLGHVGEEPSPVVSQPETVEPGRQPQELARPRRLGAGLDVGRAEELALVEDGHGGGGVMDGGDVGIGDVDGQDELGVEDWEVELEGGEVDGNQMESGVLWLGSDQCRRRHRRRRADEGRAPAPFYLFAHRV
ncbi:hypothetical protein TIFTF001_029270 [Ficus carica]|uniref:Uncharacterized protein n=1 Tax=Ficus carica TaxID=3494 RepID=A0AA88DRY8_FICCA|nr:hypothetical protein TIFTF001_029270 [Ficus carica]